jgi:uncharacterized Zn-finger protein
MKLLTAENLVAGDAPFGQHPSQQHASDMNGTIMAIYGPPHFCNDIGVEKIHIGVKEFQCMGARPPADHPHIYLDMGSDDQIVCPYCSTLYMYDPNLGPDQSDPPYCLYTDDLRRAG